MKTTIILLFLLLLPSVAFAQLEFSAKEADVGIIKVGMPIKAQFQFKNNSEKDAFKLSSATLKSSNAYKDNNLEVSVPSKSCDCVKMSGVKVEPGATGTISFEFKRLVIGNFEETITIKWGDEEYELKINGTVLVLPNER